MENRENIEAGNNQLPRTRTSSVPNVLISDYTSSVERWVMYHPELLRSSVSDRSDL